MDRYKIKYFVIAILITVLVLTPLLCVSFGRTDINEATYEELMSIKGIGDTLTTRVLSYLTLNPDCELEDLEDVKGIGPEKLKLLSEEWK